MSILTSIPIDSPWLLAAATLVAVGAVGGALLLLARPPRRRGRDDRPSRSHRAHRPHPHRRVIGWSAIVFGVGAIVAWAAIWLLIDVVDILGIPVGVLTYACWTIGIGLMVHAIGMLLHRGGHRPILRRLLAGVAVVAAALATVLGINIDAGAVHTLADLEPAAPLPTYSAPPAETRGGVVITEANWTPPAGMPAQGELSQAVIPATASGFPARPATIWLPPAALVDHPPQLPVMVMLSGQPGTTSDLFTAGQFEATLNAYAAAHHGLGPIVVTADQLGTPDANPLCVDGALGNARTYLETDVPTWIRANLPVAADRLAWTFGGFSNGGTCAYQIGLDQPAVYGTVLAISAEAAPTILTKENTIAVGFAGDEAAYTRALPTTVMQRHAPYRDTLLISAVGETDALFRGFATELVDAATKAGLTVDPIVAPGTGHDFHTVDYVLSTALPTVVERSGMVTK